jgi:hypothetical protein
VTDDFLSRWARLKSEARKPAPGEPAPDVADPAPSPDAAPPEDRVVEAAAEDGEAGSELTVEEIADLPPVEELTSATDLTPFLRAGVPSLLRNAALRRMWTIDPAIRDYVGDACEYAYDWNIPGGAPGVGPLLPSDDVKAMARRIFEGPPRPAEAKDEPGERDGEALEAGAAAEDDPTSQAERGVPDDGEPDDPCPEITSSPASIHDAAGEARPSLRTADGPAAGEPPVAPTSFRRHGGAIPVLLPKS